MKTSLKYVVVLGLIFCGLISHAAEYLLKADSGGVLIKGDRINLSIHGQVIAVTLEWIHIYYSVFGPADNRTAPDSQSCAIVQTGQDDRFKMLDYSAKVENGSVIMTMDCEMAKDEPGMVEYTMMLAPEELLAGAAYKAELKDGQVVTGTIPEIYPYSEVHYYFRDAVKAEFTSDFGKLSLEVLAGMPFNLGDRRYNQFEGHYGYWFGGEAGLTYGEKVHSEIKVTFEKSPELTIPELSVAETTAQPPEHVTDLVIAPPVEQRELLPVPQNIVYEDDFYTLNDNSAVNITVDSAEYPRLIRAAARVLTEQGGIPVAVSDNEKSDIKIVIDEKYDDIIPPENPEGYVLQVGEEGVIIVSRSPRGGFYGIQTLRNLYNTDNNGFRKCLITDYPDMEFRGAMFLVDDYSIVAHKYMIENMLAPLKMNHIIMECEYAAWDATKNLHQPHAISKDDLRELIKIANDNYIDVSPLFQTLGHCEWLFVDGQNLDMAEDPRYPYAYNVSHPGLYPLMDSILDEVMEVFGQPKYLHIGHDEVLYYQGAEFPHRPENIEKGAKKIIFDDIMHYYNYAKERGIRLMMWHDMLVTKEECPEVGFGGPPHYFAELRPQLPHDIVLADWRYSGSYPEYPEIGILVNEGFDVIGCGWYDKNNIENLSKGVKKHGGRGVLQTIWNGYFGNRQVLEDGFNQIAPYTRTACRTWNVKDEANTYDSHKLAAGIYAKMRELEPAAGAMVDIAPVANIEISAANNPFLYMDTFGIDAALKPGVTRIGQVDFKLPGSGEILRAAALKSELIPDAPEKIVIDMGDITASKLFLLHTSMDTPSRRLEAVAELKVNYTDGTSEIAPVAYYRDIAPVSEPYNKNLNPDNAIEFDGNKIWYMTWDNPRKSEKIDSIELISRNYSYYLFGVSAAE